MNWKTRICTLNLADADALQVTACPTRRRLARSFARLESLQLKRNQLDDPIFGKSSEDQIVWRELLELELQAKEET